MTAKGSMTLYEIAKELRDACRERGLLPSDYPVNVFDAFVPSAGEAVWCESCNRWVSLHEAILHGRVHGQREDAAEEIAKWQRVASEGLASEHKALGALLKIRDALGLPIDSNDDLLVVIKKLMAEKGK